MRPRVALPKGQTGSLNGRVKPVTSREAALERRVGFGNDSVSIANSCTSWHTRCVSGRCPAAGRETTRTVIINAAERHPTAARSKSRGGSYGQRGTEKIGDGGARSRFLSCAPIGRREPRVGAGPAGPDDRSDGGADGAAGRRLSLQALLSGAPAGPAAQAARWAAAAPGDDRRERGRGEARAAGEVRASCQQRESPAVPHRRPEDAGAGAGGEGAAAEAWARRHAAGRAER